MCHGFDSRPEYLVLTRVGFNTHGSGGVVVTYNLANMNSFFFFVLGAVIVLLLYFSSFDRLSHVLYIMAILNVLSMQWQKEGKKKAREGSPVGPFASLSVLEIATVDINTFYCAIHANGVRLDVLIISLCGRRRPKNSD